MFRSDRNVYPYSCIFPRERTCRCGAGTETNAGKGDTPGFPLCSRPVVVRSHQRCQQLRMPRNHCRLNQTSTRLLQGWRGNCDIQILIYESHPDNIDLREISKVTDYVVAYSCKAATTYQEEVQMNKKIVLSTQETTGDTAELKVLCKQLINKAASSRLISKAEASVLLGDLDLTVCSDLIESISISFNVRLSKNPTEINKRNLMWQYANRSADHEDKSLHEFYPIYRKQTLGKQTYIPHYVGVKGHPTFPISEGYARHVLIVYKPWRQYPSMANWKDTFETFIVSSECPKSARLTYNRVMQRFFDGTKFAETKASVPPPTNGDISKDDETTLLLAGLGGIPEDITGNIDFQFIERGIDFEWGNAAMVSPFTKSSV